jgi:hypothetical protein
MTGDDWALNHLPSLHIFRPIKIERTTTLLSYPQMNFQELVEEIKKLQDFNSNVEKIQELFRAYESKPEEWAKYLFVEKGCYTRNLVYGTKDFNLMVLCWDANTTRSVQLT